MAQARTRITAEAAKAELCPGPWLELAAVPE